MKVFIFGLSLLVSAFSFAADNDLYKCKATEKVTKSDPTVSLTAYKDKSEGQKLSIKLGDKSPTHFFCEKAEGEMSRITYALYTCRNDLTKKQAIFSIYKEALSAILEIEGMNKTYELSCELSP